MPDMRDLMKDKKFMDNYKKSLSDGTLAKAMKKNNGSSGMGKEGNKAKRTTKKK